MRQAEQAMVAPHHLFQAVAHCRQEVFVGLDHPPLRRELHHRHGTTNGLEQTLTLVFILDPLADIGSHLDHTDDLLTLIEHRHVAGLQPDFTAGLVDTLERAADRLALAQLAPQLLIFGTFAVVGVAEQSVVFAP
ncbi:hypothetical protein D3C81_1332780 [compost metagenome]